MIIIAWYYLLYYPVIAIGLGVYPAMLLISDAIGVWARS